jgi:hypothetical protein
VAGTEEEQGQGGTRGPRLGRRHLDGLANH